MRTFLSALALLAMSIPALAAPSQGVSMRATNGIGYGTTVINSLVGKINTGNVTNLAGSRVAYLTDIGGAAGGLTTNWTLISLGNDTNTLYFSSGVLTNIDGMSGGGSPTWLRISTNGTLLVGAATNIDFVSGANTTVTGGIAGATAIIGISSSGGGSSGDIYVTNAYITNLFSTNAYITNLYATTFNGRVTITSNLFATNIITTNVFSSNAFFTNIFVNNAYTTNLFATTLLTSNAFITNLFSTNAYITNLFATTQVTSNAYITNLFATNAYITNLFATTQFTSNAYITNLYATNAYITNLFVTGITGLTNNTDRAGVNVGSGIGTNLTEYARLDAPTNNFTGDMGVNGMLGTTTATASNLFATTIQGSYANQYAYWNSQSNLVGTNAIGNLIGPTNAAVVGQVLHATSTSGDTKWDYVNQVPTNSNPVVPDFTLPVNYWQTNAAFLFLAPSGVDTTGKKLQVTDVIVTNSTAAAVAVTFPGSIRVTGTAFLTNVTKFHFTCFAGLWTNVACEPVW